jgi:nucleoid-associated protein YgaU
LAVKSLRFAVIAAIVVVGAAVLIYMLVGSPEEAGDATTEAPASEETQSSGETLVSESDSPSGEAAGETQPAAPEPAATQGASDQDSDTRAAASDGEPRQEGAAGSAPADTASADTASAETETPKDGDAAATEGRAPSFDVVRVERSGEAVMAGRAEPGSEVTVTGNGEVIGKATADQRGEWVILPDKPLSAGDQELSVQQRAADGEERESKEVVVVSVPKKKPDAQRTAESGQEDDGAPLAVVVPRSGTGDTRVLQAPEEVGIASGDLVLESVNYDAEGYLTVIGRVAPGGIVEARLDGSGIGRTRGSEGGRWVLKPENPVPTGLHRLAILQLDDAGKELARVETPFARSNLLADLPRSDRFIVVQPGNSLWRIARRTLGSGSNYTVIFSANQDQISDPDLIYPGQIFVVPPGG